MPLRLSTVGLAVVVAVLLVGTVHGETKATRETRDATTESCDPSNSNDASCGGLPGTQLAHTDEPATEAEIKTDSSPVRELCGCEAFHAHFNDYFDDIAMSRGYPYTEQAPKKRYSDSLDVTCSRCSTGVDKCQCVYTLVDSGLASIELVVSAKTRLNDSGVLEFVSNPWVLGYSPGAGEDSGEEAAVECTADTATPITPLLGALLDAVLSPPEGGEDNGVPSEHPIAYPPYYLVKPPTRDLASERDLYAAEQSAAMRELHVVGIRGPVQRIETTTEPRALFGGGVVATPTCGCSQYGWLLVYSTHPQWRLCSTYRYYARPAWYIAPFKIGGTEVLEDMPGFLVTDPDDSMLEDYTERLVGSIELCENDMTYTWNTTVETVPEPLTGKQIRRTTWRFVDGKCSLSHVVTHDALVRDVTPPVVQLKTPLTPADYVQPCTAYSWATGGTLLDELNDVNPDTAMVTVSDDMTPRHLIQLRTKVDDNGPDPGLYQHTWIARDAWGNEGNLSVTYRFADNQRRITTNLGLCVWPPGMRGRAKVEFAIADIPKLVETLITRSLCTHTWYATTRLAAHVVSCNYAGPDPKTAADFRKGKLNARELCHYDNVTELLHVSYMSNTDYTDLEVGVQLRDFYGNIGQTYIYAEDTDMGDPALGEYTFTVRVPRTYSASCPISARRGELHIQARADFYHGNAQAGPNVEIVSAPMPRVSQYAVQMGLSPDVIY